MNYFDINNRSFYFTRTKIFDQHLSISFKHNTKWDRKEYFDLGKIESKNAT